MGFLASCRWWAGVVVVGMLGALACGGSGDDTPPTVDLGVEVPEGADSTAPPAETTAPPSQPKPPTTEPTAPEPEDEGPPVVLRADGLGPTLRFGAPADEILAGLTLRWAPPDSDTGWVGAGSTSLGACPGTQVRAVGWGRFSVLFSDGPTPHGPAGRRHFFTWRYEVDDPRAPAADRGGNRPALRTGEGISVGATVAELQAAYGERLELFDDSTEEDGPATGPSFGVQLPDGGLYGSLTSLGPAGRVLTMVGGGGCGE